MKREREGKTWGRPKGEKTLRISSRSRKYQGALEPETPRLVTWRAWRTCARVRAPTQTQMQARMHVHPVPRRVLARRTTGPVNTHADGRTNVRADGLEYSARWIKLQPLSLPRNRSTVDTFIYGDESPIRSFLLPSPFFRYPPVRL